MGNMFDMVKQAATMRKQMKKMQKQLAKKSVEVTSAGVTVVATGDMAVKSITMDPSEVDPNNIARLEKMTVAAVNKAMEAAKKLAAKEMQSMTGGLGGLADMMG